MSREFRRDRLTTIREARGISMHQLARQLDISSSAVQSWEAGKAQPRHEYLIQLPDIFRVPIDYFFSPSTRKPQHVSCVFFRSRANVLIAQKKMAYKRIEWLAHVVDLISEHLHLPPIGIASIDYPHRYDYSAVEIENIAMNTRKAMGLKGNGPIENLTRLCEAAGVVISKFTIANSLDAFSTWVDFFGEKRPLILVDTIKDSPGRLRFNIAHELGHLVMHKTIMELPLEKHLHKEMERQADMFASAFLMPRERFIERVHAHGTALEDVFNLKREWRVSMQAIIHRMADLSVISSDYNTKLNKRISYLGFRKKEPGDEYIPFEEPSLFELAFRSMRDAGIDIEESLRENLQLFPSDINDLVGGKFFEETMDDGLSGKVIPIGRLREKRNS